METSLVGKSRLEMKTNKKGITLIYCRAAMKKKSTLTYSFKAKSLKIVGNTPRDHPKEQYLQ